MKYNRFLPLIVPLVVFLLLELYYQNSHLIFVVSVFILLIFFFVSRQFSLASKKEENMWNLMILPSVYTVGNILFTVLIPDVMVFKFLFLKLTIITLLFFLNAIFLYFYYISIYYKLFKENESAYSLENISSYGNFLAFYFFASGIYGLQSHLNAPVWILVLSMLGFILLVVYQVLWANKVNIRESSVYILISGLVIVQIGWALAFLTLSFYILGLILAVCYYILIGLIRYYLSNRFDRKIVKLYLIFGFLSIIIVLLTSRWI